MTKAVYTVSPSEIKGWVVFKSYAGIVTVYNRHETETSALDDAFVLNECAQYDEDSDIYNERHSFAY